MGGITRLLLLTLILTVLFFSGCISNVQTDNDNNFSQDFSKFIGTWEQQGLPDPNDTSTFIFYKNGSFISIYNDFDDYEHRGWGDFKIENNQLFMNTHPHGASTDDDKYYYDYMFEDSVNTLILTNNELGRITLTRKE